MPPDPAVEDSGDGGAGGTPGGSDAADSACGDSRLDIAYVSRFAVDPDNSGRAGLSRMGLVINSGSGPLDLGALQVLSATVEGRDSVLDFAAYDGIGPLEPGEARGELSDSGRDMVLAQLSESWTNQSAPELSGLLSTRRTQGELHGSVVLALGPHRITLDLEFYLTSFEGYGALPQDASRSASACAADSS